MTEEKNNTASLKEKMKGYNPEQLIDIIKQPQKFSTEIVEIANQIAIEQDLITNKDAEELPKLFELEELATYQIHLGYRPSLIKNNLTIRAKDEALALRALNNAARSVVMEDKHKYVPNTKKSLSAIQIIVITITSVYILFRLFLLLNRL